MFGGASNNEGMGLLAFCLDWNLIGSACLWSPLWLQLNQDIGICLSYILMSAVYYGNIWKAKDFPFMSQDIFAENGSVYNQTALLSNGRFNDTKYQELGPAYFSATNALYLITSNLSLGALVTHIALFHWNDLKPFVLSLNPWNKTEYLVHDAHWEKMKAYKQIPRWWYLAILLGAYGIAQATNYTGDSGLPWWALTILLIIGFIFCALYSTLAATIGFSEFTTSGNGFFQMITAYMVPGRPIANIYGAMYGAHPLQQGIAFLQDLKLGQYCKLPPRVTFCMQMLGTVVGAILNYVMMLSIIDAQREALLSIAGTRLWSGQNAQTYNSNAIAWGALGPQMFGAHSTYKMVPISLAIGLFLPLPFYLGVRPRVFPPPDAIADMFTVPPLAEGRLPEPQHVHHSAVLVLHVRRREHTDQHVHSARDPLPVVGAHALPALVHEVQLHRRRGARRRHPDHRLHPQLCPVRRRGQRRRLPELVGQ